MKHKIAAGLGLALSLTTGICSAELLGSSQEVNAQIPYTMPLTNLSTDPGKYYTATCHVINTHATKNLSMNVTLLHGSYSPVFYDGQQIKKDDTGKGFTFKLSPNDDDKVLVIQKIHAATGDHKVCTKIQVPGKPIMIDETKPVTHYKWWSFFTGYTHGSYIEYEKTGNKIVDESKVPPMEERKDCHFVPQDDALIFSADTKNNKEMGAGYRISCELGKDFLASAIASDAAASASTAPTPATDAPAAAPVAAAPAPAMDAPAPAAEAPAPAVPAGTDAQ